MAVFSFFSVFVSVLCVFGAPQFDLYSPEDNVKILTVHNFKQSVENSETAWVITFYLSWCGGCRRFAPIWKDFAKDMISWRNLLRIGVVDCADPENIELCRECQVATYPSIKYFPEEYRYGEKNFDIDLDGRNKTNSTEIKTKIVKKIFGDMNGGRLQMYLDLLGYNGTILEAFLNQFSDNVEYVFLIIVRQGDYSGVEVALELYDTPKIAVRYSLDNNIELLENLKIEKIPSVMAFDRQNNIQIFAENVDNKDKIKKTIETFLEKKGLKVVETASKTILNSSISRYIDLKQKEKSLLRQYVKKMGDVIFYADLEMALRYSLQQEIGSVKIIKNERLDALKAYLEVIRKYFPFGYNKTSLITQTINMSSNAKEIEGASIELLVKEAGNNQFFSSPQRFVGCQGSTPRFRGYPCGLWQLFHYLTVNSVYFNINNDEADPLEVLRTIHGYVKHFFGCQHCSQHFQEMAAERNLTRVSSLQDSILWLWESHNIVNDRLKGDTTEDPEYPKEQFPTKMKCPECYENDGSWNREEVKKYLNRMYSIFNVRYIGSDTNSLFPGLS